ncbi:hypothetical protein LAG90_18690 [Marinilongibacter aquaticus]|uniref:hypothetical protein n=1 Tax=Marinilongibacter aquaticus TaxID=2975157 RepID=UPI0021BDA78C|nr:hypothetical protein [Marinilongibacter aquaticus]UBM58827.1 hypothetical protein LAG90_18690 [Marinilongibacter aquaticus]
MKKLYVLFLAVCLLAFVSTSCKDKVKPFSERVAKTWIPRLVKENGTIVYSNGGSNNIQPAYSAYKMNLSSAPTASLTEVDGNTYAGTYEADESKIVISGLSPEPTGTGGVLQYTVNSFSDDEMVITLSTAYPKTGNTTNEYTLVPQ